MTYPFLFYDKKSNKKESLNEAKESAKDASILLNVSEFSSIDEATTALVAMSQAYKELDKLTIIDKLNNIGNNFSISTDQLATGLQNAAAVLKTQGNDIDKSIALLTAANSITQDISKASAGTRTIALRIAGTEAAKKELEELGEATDDYIIQTSSKTQETIKAFTAVASNAGKGVDVLDANGNLRDTYDILLDISKVYKEIQEEDKKAGTNRANALVEYIAGKNRSNIAASILENPEMLEKVYKASQDSAGSAMEENEKYLDSIAGHIAKLQNQLQKLYSDTISSGFVKTVVDVLTGLTKIVDNISLIRTGIIGIATIWGSKKLGLFNTNDSGTILGAIKQRLIYKDEKNQYQSVLNRYTNENEDAFLTDNFNNWTHLSDNVRESLKSIQAEAIKAGKTGAEALSDIEITMEDVGSKGTKLGAVFKNIGKTLLNAFASAALSAGISWLVTNVGKLIDKALHPSKYIQKDAKAAREEIAKIKDDLNNTADTVDNVKQHFAELAQEVNHLGTINQSQGTLSNDEYKEFLDISNQLAELFPTLTQGYDDNGNAILNLSGDVDNIVESLERLVEVERQAANTKIMEEMPDVWAGYSNSLDKYTEKISNAQRGLDEINRLISMPSFSGYSQNFDGYYSKNGDFISDTYLKEAASIARITLPKDLSNLSSEYEKELRNAFIVMKNNYTREVSSFEATIKEQNSQIYDNMSTLLLDDAYVKNLSEQQRKVYQAVLSNIDFSSFRDSAIKNLDFDKIDIFGENSIDEAIYDNAFSEIQSYLVTMIDKISGDNEGEFNKIWDGIFSINISEGVYFENVEAIHEYFDRLIELLYGNIPEPLKNFLSNAFAKGFGFGDIDNDLNRVKDAFITDSSNSNGDLGYISYDPRKQKAEAEAKQQYEDFVNSLSTEDFNFWKAALDDGEIPQDVLHQGKEALENYLKELQKVAEQNPITPKASDAVDSMADMKSAVASLSDLYNQTVLQAASENADSFGTFAADPATLNSIESAFKQFISENDGTEQLNAALQNFEKISVESFGSADYADQMQNAINKLITAYVDQTDAIKNLTEENAEWSEAQLEAMGITNAHDVVQSRLSKQVKKTQQAIGKLAKQLIDYNEVMEDSASSDEAKADAISKLVPYVEDILTMYDGEGNAVEFSFGVTDEFVKKHQDDINAIAEGDIDALNRIRLAAAKEVVMRMDVDVPTEVFETQVDNIMNLVAQADAENIEIGAWLEDKPFLDALAEMGATSQATADAISRAFESMGYTATWVDNPYGQALATVQKSSSYIPASVVDEINRLASTQLNFPSLKIQRTGSSGGGTTAKYSAPSTSSSSGSGGGGGGSEPTKPKEESEETFD